MQADQKFQLLSLKFFFKTGSKILFYTTATCQKQCTVRFKKNNL